MVQIYVSLIVQISEFVANLQDVELWQICMDKMALMVQSPHVNHQIQVQFSQFVVWQGGVLQARGSTANSHNTFPE
jgi:hypothetical protein